MTINLADFEAGDKYDGDYDAALSDLQERISRLLVSLNVHGRRVPALRDDDGAAGKGGAIQRMTAKCDPRHYKVWPISAPSEGEKARHYLWRFWNRLPRDGELAIFDRSWYGRVLVERVEGFAKEEAWRRAYDEINEFEAQQTSDRTLIVKLFFHVTEETQRKRIEARLDDPWKRWKVTNEDFRNIRRRDDYLAAMKDMFRETDTRWAPWTVVDGNNKKAARIAALEAVAKALAGHVPNKPPKARPEMEQAAEEFLKGRGGSA
jgi:AMP-polyphosphate phosphotransferase